MTANQIEYWKLRETQRHNLTTEAMDKPVKESQTAMNWASVDLINEQTNTQRTIQSLNLAQEQAAYAAAYASYASGAASYAAAENYYAQAELNQQRTLTEQYQTKYVNQQLQTETWRTETQKEQAGLTAQQRIQAGYTTSEVYATTNYNTNLYMSKDKAFNALGDAGTKMYGAVSNLGDVFSSGGGNLLSTMSKLVTIFAKY